MKDTFNAWSTIGTYQIDSVMDYILTGRKAAEAKFDNEILSFVGSADSERRILDFGCGVGRNTFGLALSSPKWLVTGYDNESMIGKTPEYYELHYPLPIPPNVTFSSDWDKVKTEKFDVIICWLVLQHIYEEALVKYLTDFKTMTKSLVVAGRRINDDPVTKRSTWSILQDNGFVPSIFLKNVILVPFTPEGDPEEHNIGHYFL